MYISRRGWRICVPPAAAMVLLTACGAGGGGGTEAVAREPATSSRAATADGPPLEPADEDLGAMVADYEDAATPEAITGRDLMQQSGLLDELAGIVNTNLNLPFDISLQGKQCDEANDFWSSDDKAMVLCYEDINESLRIFADDPDPAETARRVALAGFFHELGHMAIDIYDLPTTGREEDVADQMAAFWLLTPNDNGEPDPDWVQAAKDQAREYQIWAGENGVPDDEGLADPHTLDRARMYNFECWVYGSDPDTNSDIIDDGLLPPDRADGCEDEYDKLVRAWDMLLEPHMK